MYGCPRAIDSGDRRDLDELASERVEGYHRPRDAESQRIQRRTHAEDPGLCRGGIALRETIQRDVGLRLKFLRDGHHMVEDIEVGFGQLVENSAELRQLRTFEHSREPAIEILVE